MADDGALWSRAEIQTQAAQSRGQLTVWDILAIERPCDACSAEPEQECRPDCIGRAAAADAGMLL